MAHPASSPRTRQILRGSFITLRRKCGTPTCRCSDGQLHQTPALSYSLGGSTKMLTLRTQDVPQVKAALKMYRKALQQLDREALAGIRALRLRIQGEKVRARKAKQ
jgi:hypothetical protein